MRDAIRSVLSNWVFFSILRIFDPHYVLRISIAYCVWRMTAIFISSPL